MQWLKTIGSVPSAIWRAFWQQRQELSVFLQIQAVLLAIGLFAIKCAAVAHAFEGSSIGARLPTLISVCAYDFIYAGAIGCAAWLLRFGPSPTSVLRGVLLLGIQFVFVGWLTLSVVNLEIYKSLGSPLRYNLLLLAPNTAATLLPSAVGEKTVTLLAEASLLLAAVLLSPALFFMLRRRPEASATRSSRLRVGIAPLVLLVAGISALAMPATGARAVALRNMSVFSIFALDSSRPPTELTAPTSSEIKALSELCGPDRADGKQAFESLPRKKLNVILFVWETVGARFLKSCHPNGIANTPETDALLKHGGISFSRCYVESPLTAQSAWALMTGLSPPARPVIFTYGNALPPYTTTFPAELKRAGFQTASFCAGNTEVAAMDRILGAGGFSVAEDSRTLPNRAGHAMNDWGIEDGAIVERALQWIEGVPREKPFFAMLWNIETHYPYRFAGMPSDLDKATPLERYAACVEHSDALIGKLYAGLVRQGLEKNTILIIVGDHGEGMGRPPRPYDRGHSMLVYEDDIHVPLFFIHPDLKPAQKVDFPCTLTDIFPTVMSCAGLEAPSGIDGRSLSEVYPSRPLFSRSIVWWPLAAVAGPYKMILGDPDGVPELYDVVADPAEAHELSEDDVKASGPLMRALIRYSCDRFNNDPSFDYGYQYLPSGTTRPSARPTIKDLLKR